MEVSSPVVREEDVDGFATWVASVVRRSDAVVNGPDDVGVGAEESVCFDLFQGEGDGFLAEGAADLFEGVELGGGGFLDEIHV